jgi:hypothetical protein
VLPIADQSVERMLFFIEALRAVSPLRTRNLYQQASRIFATSCIDSEDQRNDFVDFMIDELVLSGGIASRALIDLYCYRLYGSGRGILGNPHDQFFEEKGTVAMFAMQMVIRAAARGKM